MKLKIKLCLIISCVFLWTTDALADTASERLRNFFTQVQSMQADFTQTVAAQGFAGSEESKGMFRLLRPGKFRWDYTQPYQQHIIADGNKLWVYDVDMDQVIVKPLDSVLGQTPAVLLSGNSSLTERFDIEELPERKEQGLVWVALRPKDTESSYQQLVFGFNNSDIKVMELVDNFGQLTVLKFANLKRNLTIEPGVFQFVPPPGVDVIGEEELSPQ